MTGERRHQVIIQTITESPDSIGQPIPSSGTLATVWASVEPLEGRELLQARQIHAEVTHRIITNEYVSGVTPKHRVAFGARSFDILSVLNPEERNIHLEIMAKERL